MRNIKLTIASLAVTAIVSGAAAQEPAEASTPAGIERKKMESLWFTHTDNAAGAQLDAMGRYSRLGIKYDKTKGGYKRAQEGVNNDSYGFSTDGGGTFDNLGGAFLWVTSTTRTTRSATRVSMPRSSTRCAACLITSPTAT